MRANQYRSRGEKGIELAFPKYAQFLVFKRFLAKINIPADLDKCWYWNGSIHEGGYGQFWWPEKSIRTAHAAAYELFVGSRRGLCVCHSCDNRSCVNPAHLWLGTNKQNTQDMFTKDRQHDRSGENSGTAKLTNDDAGRVRTLYASGCFTQGELAIKYKIDRAAISRIIGGKAYVGGVPLES